MSQENVDTVRAGYAAWNSRDWDAALSHASPEVELVPPREMPAAGPFRGHAGAREFWKLPLETFEEIQIEPAEDFIDAGDQVIAPVRWRARGRDGIELEYRLFDLWTFRDGLIVGLQGFTTTAEALEAAGMSE